MRSVYVPKQHGAWAMLILPLLFGVIASAPVWQHALLFAAWLLAYLFAHAALQWVRSKRRAVWLAPLRLYGGLLLPVGAPCSSWSRNCCPCCRWPLRSCWSTCTTRSGTGNGRS